MVVGAAASAVKRSSTGLLPRVVVGNAADADADAVLAVAVVAAGAALMAVEALVVAWIPFDSLWEEPRS